MAGDFDFTPLLPQHTFGIDDEGAALYAHDLAAVHVLFADHIEQLAGGFVSIAEQMKRQLQFVAKLGMQR